MPDTESYGFCPFRSIIPTTQAKLGHAVTGMSERDCDGPHCALWIQIGDEEGCAFAVAARSIAAGCK